MPEDRRFIIEMNRFFPLYLFDFCHCLSSAFSLVFFRLADSNRSELTGHLESRAPQFLILEPNQTMQIACVTSIITFLSLGFQLGKHHLSTEASQRSLPRVKTVTPGGCVRAVDLLTT